jgi:hypothetical protein
LNVGGPALLGSACTVVVILAAVILHPALLPSQPVQSQLGYLWWPGDPAESVVLYGDQHQSAASDLQELQQWEDSHEACLMDPGTPAEVIGSGQLTFTKVPVMATEGVCAGFRGWVPSATWHDSPP